MGLFGPSKKEKELQAEIDRLNDLLKPEYLEVSERANVIAELQAKQNDLIQDIELKERCISEKIQEIKKIDMEISDKFSELSTIDSNLAIQEFGFYSPTFVFANSDLYKTQLTEIRNRQKELITLGAACTGNMGWTVNGSQSQGVKMVKDMQKLLLRAFNVECDDIVDKVKISNFERSKERIFKISEQISKLGKIMSIYITKEYIDLKIQEVCLALDFQQKKQEEKEKLKELKEQQREEAKAQKEIEEARKKLQKEQSHYSNALDSVMAQIAKNGETAELLEKKKALEEQIEDTKKAIEDVDYRDANKRAGYVYIISNIGAFGENVYKIGMTRRLDPMERVDELGDASVPFGFDVHALIFTEDAPGLESALHTAFESKKVNKINYRREFFRVSLDEIKEEVRKNFDKTVEWIDIPEAEQYRQSILLSKEI